jgi:signal transduction histidine kinase
MLAAGLYMGQVSLNFQDKVGLAIAWTLIGMTLLWFQIVNGFYLVVVDDLIYAIFVYSSFVHASKNKESFFHMREKIKAEVAAMEAEGNVKIMENRLRDMQDLVGNVSHDLKTPMHALSMELNSLHEHLSQQPDRRDCEKDGVDIPNRKTAAYSAAIDRDHGSSLESVQTLKDTCAFMLMTINRCLDYTKASSGLALVPKNSTVCLQEALSWAVNCVKRPTEGEAKLLVLDALPGDVCSHVITDYQWLVENVLCLVSNAVKYTMTGSIHVRCGLAQQAGEKLKQDTSSGNKEAIASEASEDDTAIHYLSIEVEDTGIGINEEMRLSLFQPFQKAQSMAGGTGLGLYSMSKRLESLRGSCGIRGRRDGQEGSLFWFTIPYVPDPDSASASNLQTVRLHNNFTMSESVEEDQWEEKVECKTILVVEDSMVIQKTTKRMLVKKGYTVDLAMNGQLGLEMMTKKKYDVVLTGEIDCLFLFICLLCYI